MNSIEKTYTRVTEIDSVTKKITYDFVGYYTNIEEQIQRVKSNGRIRIYSSSIGERDRIVTAYFQSAHDLNTKKGRGFFSLPFSL